MAKYYSLSPSTFADDFKAALEAYYGDGVAIESASGTTIIFQCPAVCDKVLKFVKAAGVNAYIGDSSASMTQFSYAAEGVPTTYNLILADAFILIDTVVNNIYKNSALVAKLSNGRYMVSGGTVNTGIDNYRWYNKGIFTDTMIAKPIRMVTPFAQDLKSNGKMCLWPAYVADDLEMVLNEDGTFAKIPGLWLTSTQGTSVVGSNYYLSQSGLYGLQTEGVYCTTQKYVELEMD